MCEFASPFPEWAGFAMASAGATGPEAPHPDELAGLPAASNALRRTTFALGRTAARRAMKAIGLAQEPVLAGPDRAPVWPPGLIGSITHTNALAAAAVAPARQAGGLGLDLEPAEGDGSLDMARLVAGPAERAWIDGSPARLICLFSAKEAIYKAFYPRHRAFFDFDAVHLDPRPGGFVATLMVPLADWSAGSRFHVRSQTRGGHVLSSVVLPSEPPEPVAVRDL